MEERVYSRSVTKEAMSHRVVEKKQIDRHYVRTELEELFFPYELKPQEKTPNFPDDDILRYLLHALPKSAYNYHEHDSLLENKPDQELNEDEKNEAWNSYLAELQGNRYQMQNMNNNPMNVNAQMGIFGKNQMPQDFMKLYNDMMGTSTSNYAQLMGLLPSTSVTASSIFAQPASTSNNQTLVPNMQPYATTSGITNSAQKKKQAKVGDLASIIKDKQQRYVPSKSPVPTKRFDALMIPPNSSENLAILPDNDHHKSPPLQALNKSFAGTSARTHQVVPPKRADRISAPLNNNSKGTGLTLDKAGRSLIRPNVIMTKASDPKSPGTIQRQASQTLNSQNSVIQKSQSPIIQRSQSFSSPVGKNGNQSQTRLVADLINQAKSAQAMNKKQNTVAVSPSLKLVNRPYPNKSPVTTFVQKKPPTQVINLGSTTTNDSVSIIKLPPKNIVQQPAQNRILIGPGPLPSPQSKAPVPLSQLKGPVTLSTQQAATITQTPSKIITPATSKITAPSKIMIQQPKVRNPNVERIIQQQQNKRFIDNRTNQTLKRIRMADSMTLSQSQNLPSQPTTPQRIILPTSSQRLNQIGSQSIGSQAPNTPQIVQVRGLQKSSQQPNKNSNQIPAEIVELE